MKHYSTLTVILCLCAAVCTALTGCSANHSSDKQKSDSQTPLSSQSSEPSATSDTPSTASEVSQQPSEKSDETTSSSVSQTEIKPFVQELRLLNEYSKKLESEGTRIFYYTEERNAGGEVYTGEEKTAQIQFVQSVIRDINNDGHYEMIVKYDGRGTDINNEIDDMGVFVYDVVTIVDGKAVESGHWYNEEGFLNHGSAH
ncbi:MAG: hypothetical protein II711_01425 [Clostridia bacterium]|nr:hypothetical protein [Clostridia bacterium]